MSNSSVLQDKSEILLLIILGNYLMIVGGWLERTLMKSGVLLALRKGKYLFVARLKVTSKKSVSIRFVSMVIESPSSLNN